MFAKVVSGMKKEGTENLVGSLTFKMLEVEKECFEMLKLHACMIKIKIFTSKLVKIFYVSGFNNLRQFKPLLNE